MMPLAVLLLVCGASSLVFAVLAMISRGQFRGNTFQEDITMKMDTSMRRVLIVALAGLVMGCGSSSPTAPSTPAPPLAVAGNWAGSITSSTVGTGSVVLTIAQSGTSLSGTWSSSWPNPANNNAGALAGTIDGSSVSVTLTPGNPTYCSSRVNATVNSASAMSGTYAAVNCSVALGGTVSVTKK